LFAYVIYECFAYVIYEWAPTIQLDMKLPSFQTPSKVHNVTIWQMALINCVRESSAEDRSRPIVWAQIIGWTSVSIQLPYGLNGAAQRVLLY